MVIIWLLGSIMGSFVGAALYPHSADTLNLNSQPSSVCLCRQIRLLNLEFIIFGL